MTQAAILAASGSPGTTTGFKNRIINGNMNIDQRYNGTSITPATTYQYTLDRWETTVTQSSKLTVQQNSGNAPVAQGFASCMKITSSSAYSSISTDRFTVEQYIEGNNVADLGWGTASAKSVTLSFWVYSSLTGTFGGSILASGGSNQFYPFSYSIPTANTWTQISVTIPGNTTIAINTNTSTALTVYFDLGVGSNFKGTANAWTSSSIYSVTGATSVVGTSGATWYLTGVQIEVGTTATNFDFRSYGTELQLCQRYCFAFNDSTSAGNASYGVGNVFNASNINICGFFPISMRIAPTGITVTSPTSFFIGTGGSNTTTSSISYGGCSTSSYGLSCAATGVTSGTVILLNNSRGGQLLWSAEL